MRTSGLVVLLAVLVGLFVVPAAGPPTRHDLVVEAPDEAAARIAARTQGTRVAMVNFRSEDREVFAEPSGLTTAEFSAVPVRVKQGSSWVPIDTTMVKQPDGTVGPRAAIGSLTLSPGGNGPLASVERDGRKLSFFWPDPLPVPTLARDSATYHEVLPGVDLVMLAERDGVAQHFVIKSVEAAGNPALAKLSFRIDSGGLKVTVDESGVIHTTNEQGKELFSAPQSLMWDSSGDRTAPVGVSVGDGMLTVSPDLKFLSDPATVYPVIVDPRTHTPGWNNWATVLSGKKTTAFPRTSGAGPDLAQVGNCYTPGGGCAGIGAARAYFQFDTTILNGSQTLFSAKLITQVANSPNCERRRHDLYIAYAQLNDGLTWNSQPASKFIGWADAPVVHGCANENGAVEFPFDVGEVTRGGFSAYYLRAQDEVDQIAWRRYYSAATKLSVTYNTPPNPAEQLTTDPPMPAPCRWCGGESFVGDNFIRLQTRLSDADNEVVKPEWNIYRDGVLETRWGDLQNSGSSHSTDIDLRSLNGVTIDWYVHGWDVWSNGDLAQAGGWGRGPGPFVVDQVGVDVAPTVSGVLYADDNRWHGGVGVPGTFSFGANGVMDIDHYLYGWNDPPSIKVDAASLGGPATVSLLPPGDGPRDLYVQSVDRAGHRSPTKVYHFYVRPGNGPLAQWAFEGNTKDDANLGFRDGTPNGNVTYGSGAVGSAVRLDGNGSYVTAPNTVRTDTSFSVSAWVKLDRTDDGWYTAVSQDGTNVYGFSLEYEGNSKQWTFVMTGTDTANVNAWYYIKSPVLPVAGAWTHLTGTYDSTTQQLKLYVNGVPVGSTTRATLWNAGGLVRIGQVKGGTGYGNNWAGAVDEVRLYDRVLSDAEVRSAVARDNVQVGHWKFDEQDTTTAANDIPGGEMAVLENGAQFVDHGAANNAVQFDGVDDVVSTNGPMIRTDQSFSVAAWVKVDRRASAGNTFTAVSQDGTSVSGFYLGYREADGGRWEFFMPSADGGTRPADAVIRSTELIKVGEWTHLAAVYDAPSRQLRLYVGGRLVGSATATSAFNATGKFIVGRGKWNGGPANAWPGGVDEVRAFSRAISAEEIQGIVSGENVKALSWKLDGTASDTSGQKVPRDGTVKGGAAWTGGQAVNPDQNDLAVNLDGVDDYVTSVPATDTSGSFSVSAWVKLNSKPAAWAAVASQNGEHSSMFNLGYTGSADDHWAFAVHSADVNGPDAVRVRSTQTTQSGTWTHLTAVYQASTGDMLLYVNGVLSATGNSAAHWNAASSFDVGRARWGSAWIDYLPAAVDDVQVYGRPLFAEEIRAMAGRDLALVHNWRLDESSGPNVADSIGTRTATLTPGTSFAPGRVGNAVRFDGTGAVTTNAVDLRTDDSFTVSTWVYLTDSQCELTEENPACKRVALSVDGDRTSKFRLGHVVDQDHYPEGVWIFEMPETDADDAPITQAAVAARPADMNTWVHLVGVYDQQTKKIWLYVDGKRRGDGTVNNRWQAGKGVAIGRGKANGAAGQFWPGSVDDVRMYTGALTGDRIFDLFGSYPPEDGGSAGLPTPDAGYWTFDETSGDTVADSSDRGLTATIKGGGERISGRAWSAGWFDGESAYAETAGPAVDTSGNFSIAAWAYLTQTNVDRTVIGQDGDRESAFRLQYNSSTGKWAIAVPPAGSSSAGVLLTSTQPAVTHQWAHLAVVYNAGLRQLRLYVNGVLSAAQTGVTIPGATGPLSMGRAKRNGANAEFLSSGIDDVRAFSKALTDNEVTSVHDDVPTLDGGGWRFDEGTGADYSWRHDHTTLSGGTSFGPGVIGKALQLDGVSGQATAQSGVATSNESFTVSAWVRLARNDRTSTVLSQDGDRMSGFALQFRPELNRWVFSASINDSDSAGLVYAQSLQTASLNRWTHLTGVYDYNARQLRLYVDGQLSGARSDVTLWQANGAFAIGRGKYNGASTEFFNGAIDEVHAFLGMTSQAQIQTLAGYPEPWDDQLGRAVNVAGDHYSTTTTEPMPVGYHFESSLGVLVVDEQDNTKMLYSCMSGSDEFTSADPACEGQTRLGEVGRVYTKQPSNLPTIPIYRCKNNTDHFESRRSDCEGTANTSEGVLGYTVAYSWLTEYYSDFDHDHFDTINGGPAGYQRRGVAGLLSLSPQPGTQSLMSCVNGVDTFVSLDVGCEGKTVVTSLGQIWAQAPTGVGSRPLYRCAISGESFVSVAADCEGYTMDKQLGFVLTDLPDTPAVFPAA
jgi:concanavalin A-like lectin/glucanase superfamily protein